MIATLGTLAAIALAPPPELRRTVDLSGEWEFRMDPADVGRTEKWFDPRVPYDRKIRVPGAWNAQGVAFESEPLLREHEQKLLNGRNLLGVDRESDKLFHVYPGPAWYRRRVAVPADWKGRTIGLAFHGAHRRLEVWVNGEPAGSHASYLTPLRIDLTGRVAPGSTAVVAARVDARRDKGADPLMGCLDTLDFLYVSWGGLHRAVTLESRATTWIEDLFVAPRPADGAADVRLTLGGRRDEAAEVAVEILDAAGTRVAAVDGTLPAGATQIDLAAPLPGARPWSPKSPHLYTARATLRQGGAACDAASARFGMRELRVADGAFLLNGKPVFLRGYGDDCIFPNTIAPPADQEELRRRLSAAKDYGFNYARHHSWIPTEEYLDAADEVGMMVQVEFPIAYRWDLVLTPEGRRFYQDQWEAAIRLNRNHPSIVTWCMGNELYDSFDLAPDLYRRAKALDPTRLVIDSDGCGFQHARRETLDFLVVQFNEGGSIGFQDGKYGVPTEVRKPVVAHEMGYFVTLHDLAQFGLFKGGMRPYWLLQTRDLAAKNGVADLYPRWLEHSYRLQAVCLKTNIEAARRSRLGGYHVWLFQDYPNCAEGVVDMFLRPKALAAAEFRRFNAPTVLLLDAPRRNVRFGETVELKLLASRFEDEPSDDARLRWELRAGNGVLASGSKEGLRVAAAGVQELLAFPLPVPRRPKAEKLTLAASLTDGNGTVSNAWDVWAFPDEPAKPPSRKLQIGGPDALRQRYPGAVPPSPAPRPSECDLLVTTRLDAGALAYAADGGRVLLLAPETAFPVENTNYRLSSWDGGGPSGTAIDRGHPALRGVPSDGWCDLQFYPLIQGSKTVALDALPVRVEPLVRCIDRPTRLANRAYLFEVSVGKGRLLVCGFNVARAAEQKDPAALFLFDQLVLYALGPPFGPPASLPVEDLQARLKK